MKTYNEIFAENLKRIMRVKGLSQRELGRKLGVSANAVSLWCKGDFVPRANMMDKLCNVLDISQAELTIDRDAIPNLSIPASFPLPILGTICCGDGKLCDESFDGFFFVDNSIRADYCLRVEGDSMKDANINHGDIAFIRKASDYMDGRVYAVLIEDRAVLRKIYKQPDGLLLMPCNEVYKPIVEKDAFVIGECIGIYSTL